MWTFKELFELSQRSDESRNSVRLLTSTMSPMKIQDTDGLSSTIKLSRENQQEPCVVEFHSETAPALQMIPDGQFQFFNLNGTEMRIAFVNESLIVCGVTQNPQLASLVFVAYLKDVFSAKFDNLIIGIEREDLKDLDTKNLEENVHFHVEFGFVSHEEMRMILEQKCHTAELGCLVQEGFRYDQVISTPTLHISYSQWFTLRNLLTLQSSRIKLGNSNISSRDLNTFIRQWLASDNTKLEYLAVYGSLRKRGPGQFELDMEEVTEGMRTLPGSDKNRYQSGLEIKGAAIKYEEGVDVSRDSDGLAATILYGKTASGQNFFVFHVWQHLKPVLAVGRAPNHQENIAIPNFHYPEDSLDRKSIQTVTESIAECFQKLKMGKSEDVSHQEMQEILESGERNLNLMGCDPGRDFVYEKKISCESFKCDDSQWFSGNNLLNINFATARLRKSTLTSQNFNDFIRTWLSTKSTDMVHLGVVMDEGAERLDMKVIANGVLTMPGSEKRDQSGLYIKEAYPIPYQYGMDVLRDEDGLLATVILSETEFGQQVFAFVVWHPKDPKISAEDTESPVYINRTLEKLTNMSISDDVSNDILANMVQGLDLGSGDLGAMDHGTMMKILEDGGEKIDTHCNPGDGFVFEKKITTSSLKLHNSQWLTGANLLNIDASRIILRKSTLTSEDLNAFINHWLNSSNTKLEHLAVISDKANNLDINAITKDILVMPEAEVDKKKYWTSLYLAEAAPIPYQDGMDLERDSDGVVATVLVSKARNGKDYFVFNAWHRLREDVHQTEIL